MALNRARTQGDFAGGVFLDSETLDRLKTSSDGARFAAAWLTGLSGQAEGMRQGLVVLAGAGSKFEPLAVWPEGAKPERAMMNAVENALRSSRTIMLTLSADEGEGVAIASPISVGGQLRGAVAVTVAPQEESKLRLVLDQLQWSSGWLETLIRRRRLSDSDGLVTVIELLATSLHHNRFQEAATAAATELAGALNCERVAIGFLRGRHARLRALSHSASFGKRTNLVRAIEAAMDEAMDQQATIVVPEPDEAPERVVRSHHALMRTQEISSVCTVPLAEGRRVIGALLLERSEPFDAATVQLCEHAAALLGPTLDVRRREDRWLPAKIWESMGNSVTALIGPRHAVLKLSTLVLAGVVTFFWFATGTYRVTADAVVEGRVQRSISAPVAGYVAETATRAGDIVREGEIIAMLDMTDLRLEKLKWSSERAKQQREYSQALARKERSRARILDAQIEQGNAQIALLDQQIERMRILAPFDGIVVSGDLSQALGAPVERGDVLFQIAPLDGYRVMLKVNERDIGDLATGQTGHLALSSMPDRRFDLEVNRITPISTAEEGLNYFMVEAEVGDAASRDLRPGMEGVGKIEIAEHRLIWIWTRKIVLWARMFYWSWAP